MGTVRDRNYPLDLISLAPDADRPMHRQLCDQLRDLILNGAVPANSRLPSIRSCAAALNISRNTVIAALDQLTAEGLVQAQRGSGITVAPSVALSQAGAAPSAGRPPELSARGKLMASQPRVRTIPGHTAFHPGMPDLSEFPFKTWSRLLIRHARYGGEDLFGYHYILGHPQLRSAIARFLTTMRRVRCTPDQIVVTTGGQAALDLLVRVLVDDGETIWMEEPGYLGARGAFLAAGARLWPLDVGRDGWKTDTAGAPRPALIYLTPSCQHPLGITMPLDQRLALLEAAREADAWVIEDDFDGEYTFRGQPQPAMQGLTENPRVIYLGTFAKMLFPAMRLGFMVVPEDIADRMKVALSLTGQFAPLLLQATLADFIDQGYFFRHLNRVRRIYGQRRALFTDLFRDHLSEWLDLYDGWSGIQIAAGFRTETDDAAVVARCKAEGINPAPLSLHYAQPPGRPGLLMGYATVPEDDMRRGFATMRRLLESDPPGPAPARRRAACRAPEATHP
ncbi:MAG: PLP-dependent aminotransferase family protein [Rhodobiaceae bacterium]|nr:PLP-dependent aminotransferase family protein [Rhodobiaceae bacterium]